MTIAVPERVKITLAMLTRAANDGAPCPSNDEIAERIGAESSATAVRTIALLEVMGCITVQRGNDRRVVTIVATGKCTAGTIRNPIKPRPRVGRRKVYRRRENAWTAADDGFLMDRIAEGDDFEQAAFVIGKTADVCEARFGMLAAQMGAQAV
jgi:hypothetical protein